MSERIENIIVIGDTHFGVRNNSMTWLKHQKAGFEEIIKYVDNTKRSYDFIRIIHVGDLFDSRSSINPLVWREVVNLLTQLDKVMEGYPCHMDVIGGNHDYYYPWETERNFTGIEMLPSFKNIHTIVNNALILDNLLLIPWFTFHNKKLLKIAMDTFSKTTPNGGIIFTHTDPFHMDPEIKNLISGHRLITGHIHQPYRSEDGNLLVTGATYPIDFTDTNSHRGFWTITRDYDTKKIINIEFRAVHSSIHFHTITEEALENWEDLGIHEDDYVEILIKQSHVPDHEKTIKKLVDLFGATTTPLPEENNIIFESTEVLNVDSVCRKMLPEKLKGPYQQMVEALSKKE